MSNLVRELIKAFRDVLPLIVVITFFHLVVLRERIPNLPLILLGVGFVIIGLFLFLQGLQFGVFPLGETLSYRFAERGNVFLLIFFSFFLGYTATIAEPALIAVAEKAELISSGKFTSFGVRNMVALGAALGISIGVLRILLGHPIYWYICTAYVLVMVLTYFSPKEIIGLAFDSGGVTTSTITVPLVTALGIGLATFIEGRDPLADGFGLVAFTALGPILTLLGYGIWAL